MKRSIFTFAIAAIAAISLGSCNSNSGTTNTPVYETVRKGEGPCAVARRAGITCTEIFNLNPDLHNRTETRKKTIFEMLEETLIGPDTTQVGVDTLLVAQSSSRLLKKGEKSYRHTHLETGDQLLVGYISASAAGGTTTSLMSNIDWSFLDWLFPILLVLLFLSLLYLIYTVIRDRFNGQDAAIAGIQGQVNGIQGQVNENSERIAMVEDDVDTIYDRQDEVDDRLAAMDRALSENPHLLVIGDVNIGNTMVADNSLNIADSSRNRYEYRSRNKRKKK